MLRAGAADILQPSPTKVGGLGEARKIVTLAAAWNVSVVPHSFYFGPGLAAALHLAAATPGMAWVEWPMGRAGGAPPRSRSGRSSWLSPPAGPGSAGRPSETALRDHPLGAAPSPRSRRLRRGVAPVIRLAVVGLGYVAREVHLRSSGVSGTWRSWASWTRRRRRSRGRGGESGFGRASPPLEALLDATRPDAALVLTPKQTHHAAVRRLLAAGVDVFCEKPLATTVPEAEAARRPGGSGRAGPHGRLQPPLRARLRGGARGVHGAPAGGVPR